MTSSQSSRPESISNRTVAFGAVGLVVILLLGILIVVLAGDDTPVGSPGTTIPVTVTTPDGSVVPGSDSPSIIPRPNEGTGPTEAGDPGGASQLALFGVLILSLAVIGFVVFRGGKKTRANRALWLAAANEPEPPPSGSTPDPAADAADQPDPTPERPADNTPV